jgi:hypothetical protein
MRREGAGWAACARDLGPRAPDWRRVPRVVRMLGSLVWGTRRPRATGRHPNAPRTGSPRKLAELEMGSHHGSTHRRLHHVRRPIDFEAVTSHSTTRPSKNQPPQGHDQHARAGGQRQLPPRAVRVRRAHRAEKLVGTRET